MQRTGQIIHGYAPIEPHLTLYTLEKDGSVSLAGAIDAPNTALVHDLAITQDHVILPLGPIEFDLSILFGGGVLADALCWKADKGLHFSVRSRTPGQPTQWFRAPPTGYFIHFGNAHQHDEKLIFDAFLYEDGERLLQELRSFRAVRPVVASLPRALPSRGPRAGPCSARGCQQKRSRPRCPSTTARA